MLGAENETGDVGTTPPVIGFYCCGQISAVRPS